MRISCQNCNSANCSEMYVIHIDRLVMAVYVCKECAKKLREVKPIWKIEQ